MIHAYMVRLVATAFLVAVMLLTCHLSHAAEQDVPQMMLVVAYEKGSPVAAQAIGFAPSLTDCQAGLQAELAQAEPAKGILYVAVCTPLPPGPR